MCNRIKYPYENKYINPSDCFVWLAYFRSASNVIR